MLPFALYNGSLYMARCMVGSAMGLQPKLRTRSASHNSQSPGRNILKKRILSFAAVNDGIIYEINEGGIWEVAEGRLRGTGRLPCPSLSLSGRDGVTVCGRSGRDPRHVALSSLQTTVRCFKHPRYFGKRALEMSWFDEPGILSGSFLKGALGEMIERAGPAAGQLDEHILSLGFEDGIVNADLS